MHRNGHVNHVFEGKMEEMIEVKERRGIRRKKLLDGLKETRECSKLEEEALDRTLWRFRFGSVHGSVVRQNAE